MGVVFDLLSAYPGLVSIRCSVKGTSFVLSASLIPWYSIGATDDLALMMRDMLVNES